MAKHFDLQKRKILLIAGGEEISSELIRKQWPLYEKVIAVDGGGNNLYPLGLVPHYILGDMDSLMPEAAIAWQGKCIFHKYPSDKNETDLELAIRFAAELDGERICILGGVGSRLDHTLTNLGLLIMARKLKLEASLVFPGGEAFLAAKETNLQAEIGDIISLIPLSPEVKVIETMGLKFPLERETLYLGKSRGVHNEAIHKWVTIRIAAGWLLVLHYDRLLPKER